MACSESDWPTQVHTTDEQLPFDLLLASPTNLNEITLIRRRPVLERDVLPCAAGPRDSWLILPGGAPLFDEFLMLGADDGGRGLDYARFRNTSPALTRVCIRTDASSRRRKQPRIGSGRCEGCCFRSQQGTGA